MTHDRGGVDPAGHSVRVMTWNLWFRFGPWEARQPAILDVLRAEAPDIVFLQECWYSDDGSSQAAGLAEELGMFSTPAEGRYREGLALGNAVLSRWPITSLTHHPLPDRDANPGHRRALTAIVESPFGPWPAVCAHLDYMFDASSTRSLQVAELLAIAARIRGDDPLAVNPLILGADLNAVPDSDEVRTLTGRRAGPVPGIVFNDVWEQAGEGPGHTWSSANPYLADAYWPQRRLDYLMVSWPRPRPAGNPVRAWLAGVAPVGGVQPSDHYAVVADLRAVTP